MAWGARLILSGTLVCLATFPSFSSLRFPDSTAAAGAADRGWARGPVWYLMTHAEYAAYRRLRTEPARRGFIRQFWSLRDPLPETAENELEREFWRRVSTADGHFGQEIKPGWKTERGKIFIMLGPPENIEQDQILQDRTGSASWLYNLGGMPSTLRLVLRDALGLPTDRPVVKIKVREEAEGTRTSARAMPVQSSVLRPTDVIPLAETLVRRLKGQPDPLRQLGQIMRVPEAIEPPARVNVSTVFAHVPLKARVDFRPGSGSAAGRRTAVALTLSVSARDLETAGIPALDPGRVLVTGHLTSADDPGRRYLLNGAFVPDPRPDPAATRALHTFQAVMQLPAGSYMLAVAWQDTEDRVMGALHDRLDVPAFGGEGFDLSSLILASRLERLEDPPGPTGPDETPFAFGPYRVIPRTSASYVQPDELLLFYRAYGATRDDKGLPRLDVTYQFYMEDGARWLPVGAPIQTDGSTEVEQAWAVPLAGWAPGNYRLEVTVIDTLSGQASVRGARFTIEPPPL
jgi:GWxTD domain-containing protein